ncbi:hypothetical protein [Seohaeicola zhoushanensis]|uniref:Uncharacterized protein n=1 Tax=Seohaeicola zhoushanensis TaxID=1569283 RepID=A0A8J3GVW8_9RHOB|nr:hypothetical protein [Seohaeicola zhoushanensis]GHF41355.1 hypothetical protein GCM10017056_11200 [Seohaeicola zhoushanensis]
MLGILAHTFLTATRHDTQRLRPLPPRKWRWLPGGHWWLERPRGHRHDL